MSTGRFRLNLFLLIILFVVLVLFFVAQSEGSPLRLGFGEVSQFLSDRNIEIEGASLASAVLQDQWTLIEKVEECKTLLKNSPKLEFVEKGRSLIRKQVVLCVLNIETGEVFEKRYWLDQKDVERANSIRRNYKDNPANLPRFVPIDPNDEFEVINNWWNNWNSDWSIEKNALVGSDIYVVAADKFLVPNSYIVYPEDKTGPKYSEIIYVPYSESIHGQEAVKKGVDYVVEKVLLAFEGLRSRAVESRAFPGQLVVDTVSEKFVKEILVNEQTDPNAILNKATTDEEKRKVAERVLVRYGLNGDKAFRYTVSKTGASGLAQIMATTYSHTRKNPGIVQKYPEADLIKDIEFGRVDPVNSIMTEILVFDDKLKEVKLRVAQSGAKAKKIFDGLTPDQLDEVRAMGYNGGSTKYDVNTGTLKTKAIGRKAKLGLLETKDFINKLRLIRYLKLFAQ